MNWKMKKYNTLIVSSIILLLFSCGEKGESTKSSRVATLPYYQEATFTPHWLTPGSLLAADFHQIPDFKLVNQLGDTVSQKDLENKIYVTDFFFTTCPGICPKMTANMAMLQSAFLEDDEVMLLSHSVTPAYDSVPVLREYADNKGILSETWWLLTGDRNQIYDLGRNQYYVEESQGLEKDIDDFLHTENFILIDKDKHIRGIYNGLRKNAINQLIADIETLKRE